MPLDWHETGADGQARHTRQGGIEPLCAEAKDGRKVPAKRVLFAPDTPPRPAQRLYCLDAEAIDYVELEGNNVALHVDDEKYLARNTLKYLADVLEPLGFVRIQRYVLLNLRRVAFAQPLDRNAFVFTLRNGRRLISNSRYRKTILDEIRRGQFATAAAAH